MNTIDLLLFGQLGSSVTMIFGWLVACKIKNTSYVDVLWAYGVGVLGLFYLVVQTDQCHPARLALLQGLVGVWSVRLGTYLLKRCWGKQEDARYAFLRSYLGKRANLGFFLFFQVQAFWIDLFASPFLILARNPLPLGAYDHLGVLIWVLGFTGVTLADKQMQTFKRAANRTRKDVCRSGLWKFSRHPNYFFEWILWLSYLLLGMNASGAPLLLFIPPVLYLFLTKVTGIPFVEARKLEASGDAYQSYVSSTPSFFPWFPKKTKPEE